MDRKEKSPPMTEAERLALAAKLDKELDDFIESLPKRQPSAGGPMDENWLEEFDTHPFFMKQLPEAGDKVHPLYEGLQQLKYDPLENTPEELALSYKEDGNFNFKHKNYRLAVISYTEGLRARCSDEELEATLYNNRSAAQWHLKNYRSALRDAEWALARKPRYEKALMRAAQCCYATEKFDDAISYCDRILDEVPGGSSSMDAAKLRVDSVQGRNRVERDRRKREKASRRRQAVEQRVVDELRVRGLIADHIDIEALTPDMDQLHGHRVHFDEDGEGLVWPVVFTYPEYDIVEFVQRFPENATFLEQLEPMFEEAPDWDARGDYKPCNMAAYYEGKRGAQRIDLNRTLKEVIQQQDFTLLKGTPLFVVFARGTGDETRYLQQRS